MTNKTSKKKIDADKIFLIVSSVINLLIISFIILSIVFDIHLFNYTYPCVFRSITGKCCPGCGLTRSVDYLIHLHPIKSLIYHPLVIYILAVYVYLIIGCIFRRPDFLKRNEKTIIRLTVIGVILLFVQWGIKLIFPII